MNIKRQLPAQPKPQSKSQAQPKPQPKPQAQPQRHQLPPPAQPKQEVKRAKGGLFQLLKSFIPQGLYDPDSKKLFGFFSPEDILLIALIFLFLSSDDDDSGILCLALLYVLLSDFIDLSELL